MNKIQIYAISAKRQERFRFEKGNSILLAKEILFRNIQTTEKTKRDKQIITNPAVSLGCLGALASMYR